VAHTLRVVRTPEEIGHNITVFNASAKSHSERVRLILHQTTYWVYDATTDQFGPSKFIAFSGMNFMAYEDGLQKKTKGVRFDGNVTRIAIEGVMGAPYRPDPILSSRLQTWANQLLGEITFAERGKSKWRFLRLAKSPSYWAVVVNPKVYRIDDVLRNEAEDTWTVNDSDVRAGDRLALWKAKAGEASRGIISFAEVLSDPSVMEVPATHREYCVDPNLLHSRRRVKIKYVGGPNLPLWLGEPGNEDLAALSVARATGGTVFKITEAQWNSIMALAVGWHPCEVVSEQDVLFAVTEALGRKRGGQGFSVDPRTRKVVENHAVSMAKAHFVAEGYDVEPEGKPYDLYCKKSNEVLYVEVKGTQTDGADILLTPNEVDFANKNSSRMALFVVRRIKVSDQAGTPVASGGDPEVKRPWKPLPERLTPIGYSYRLQPEKKNGKAEFA
jgi:hypothetical protein